MRRRYEQARKAREHMKKWVKVIRHQGDPLRSSHMGPMNSFLQSYKCEAQEQVDHNCEIQEVNAIQEQIAAERQHEAIKENSKTRSRRSVVGWRHRLTKCLQCLLERQEIVRQARRRNGLCRSCARRAHRGHTKRVNKPYVNTTDIQVTQVGKWWEQAKRELPKPTK